MQSNVHPLPSSVRSTAGVKTKTPQEQYEANLRKCTGRYKLCIEAATQAFADAGFAATPEMIQPVATSFFIECNRSQRL